MQRDRVRWTALAVAVLCAVAAMAVSVGGAPSTTATAADPTAPLDAPDGTTSGPSGASGATDPGGVAGASGATGATPAGAVTGPTGSAGSSGSTGTTGSSGATGATGASGATGSAEPGTPASTPGVGGSAGAGTPSPSATPTSSSSGGPTTTGGSAVPTPHAGAEPVVTSSTPQPQSALGAKPTSGGHSSHGGTSTSNVPAGPTAPSPALFAGSDPLAGVLPGSWNDPFIVNGRAEVPAFYVASFHIPPFLLPIYEAAGAAYGIPWQTLAAINEVETDYGTNLDVSSAGAIGWMQFLPSTWKRYGVDASASGKRDPYNAADAIFSAARYLAAAGGAHNLPAAIFAYNHSRAYVQSVLLRAELLSGEPSALLHSVSELAEGDFPIQLRYHASYRSRTTSAGANPATVAAPNGSTGAAPSPGQVGATAAASRTGAADDIFAASGAAVVAAQDATIVAIGHNRRLGRFVVIRNAFGDHFTYGNLKSVSPWYPVARTARLSSALLSTAAPAGLAPGPRPNAPASAGAQSSGSSLSSALFRSSSRRSSVSSTAAEAEVVDTLNLRSSPSAGTLFTPLSALERAARIRVALVRHADLAVYFTGAFGLRPSQLELSAMKVGSHVMAGTILGHLARTTGGRRPHLIFELRAAGSAQASIDPRPFLDAWSQLEVLELHRDSFNAPFYGPNLHAASVGTVLLTSQVDIERTVLQDARVTMPTCERAAVAAGNVDRRALASLEVLAIHGIDPTVSGAWCATGTHKPATPAILKTGDAIAITALGGRPAVADAANVAISALRSLHGAARPSLSETLIPGEIVISFAPPAQARALAAAASFTAGFALSSTRWAQLDARLAQIREPRVPTAVSSAALPAAPKRSAAGAHKRHSAA